MSNKDIEALLHARIERFVEEIGELVRESAVAAVSEALGTAAIAVPKTRGRRSGSKKKPAPTRRKRVRRSAEDLEKVGAKVVAYVAKNAGCRMEDMSKALGISTKELRRPVQELLTQKQLKTKGQKRATEYYPGRAKAKKS